MISARKRVGESIASVLSRVDDVLSMSLEMLFYIFYCIVFYTGVAILSPVVCKHVIAKIVIHIYLLTQYLI